MVSAALQEMSCPMCPWMWGQWGWSGMILMGLFWLLVIALLIWLVYRLLVVGIASRHGSLDGPGARSDAAQDILRERYARGEIDRETYERMQEDLRRGRAGGE